MDFRMLSILDHAQKNVALAFFFLFAKPLGDTLESGIDVAPEINVAPSLKDFHIRIFYSRPAAQAEIYCYDRVD